MLETDDVLWSQAGRDEIEATELPITGAIPPERDGVYRDATAVTRSPGQCRRPTNRGAGNDYHGVA